MLRYEPFSGQLAALLTDEVNADGAYFRVHCFARQLGSPDGTKR
jgi:hypothetical protein